MMRVLAKAELLCHGRVVRVCLSPRWQLGALWFCGTLWVAIGPVRALLHTRRMYWSEP